MREKEWKTRKEKIDKKLHQCGWKDIVNYSPSLEIPFRPFVVTGYPTTSGPADYILFVQRKPLGVIEGKKASIDPYGSLQQAQRYSRDFPSSPFKFEEYHVPFIYSSNGDDVWFQDLRKAESRSKKIFIFHPPEALKKLLEFDDTKAREYLSQTHYENPNMRYYQIEAIRAIEDALLQNKRKMLVHMATGTGKSWMTPALVYRLIKSGLFKRILYLVDRKELGKQERGFFGGFEPEPGLKFDKIYQVVRAKENTIPKNVDVYICTIQRMYSMLKGKEMPDRSFESDDPWEWDSEDTPVVDYNPNIPIDTFDYIISDECHRSIYNKWKVVLDYFDAVQIGFTATPAAHTYAYFDQNLVYKYPYEKAVQDGYIVDFDVVNIATDVTVSGATIPPGQRLKAKERWTGEVTEVFPEDELIFDASEIERKITVIDRNRRIVKEISKRIREDQKTLVFAVDDAHADQLVRILREKYSHRGDRFVEKITYRADRPSDLIKSFRNRPYTKIAVTVDMLSTGIDIPAIENIVIVRPVQSYVLLWQIIGRGTRKSEGKSHFTIFDCAGIMEAFREKDPKFDELYRRSQSMEIGGIVKQLKMKWRIPENIQHLKKKLVRISKEIDPEAKPKIVSFIGEDLESFAQTLEDRFEKDYRATVSIFENEQFLKFLEEFPRKPRYFLIDEITRDEIIADEYLFYTTDGKSLKPEDYIISFEKFVKEKKDNIDAIKILLEKPKDLKISTLKELRKVLASQPELFTEDRLRRSYKNPLADIVAFVRHAALAEPLGSRKERVEKAFQKLYGSMKFTQEQERWLELIRAHLVGNIIIEQEDFGEIPFSRKGGWKAANRAFDFQLPTLLDEINGMV